MNTDDVQVRGVVTAEEVAAVVAALQRYSRGAESESTLERWRRQRQKVLRDNR